MQSRPTYYIVGWDEYFETAESRRIVHLRWVAVPNRHDGKSYGRITQHPKAVEIFCAWQLIVEVASKLPTRGILADDDGPLDASDLAAKTRFPENIFETAFEVLSGPKIGWMGVTEMFPPVTQPNLTSELQGVASHACAPKTGQDRTGQDRTGQGFQPGAVILTDADSPPVPGGSSATITIKGAEFILPPFIPLELWRRWEASRRSIRKTLTPLAVKQQLADLAAWHAQGHDIERIILDSINGGYQGLFAPKGSNNGRRPTTDVPRYTGPTEDRSEF